MSRPRSKRPRRRPATAKPDARDPERGLIRHTSSLMARNRRVKAEPVGDLTTCRGGQRVMREKASPMAHWSGCAASANTHDTPKPRP